MPSVALLGSPLLGPAVWRPVAAELRRRYDVLVPPPLPAAPQGPDDVLAHWRAHLPDGPLQLVVHSNAGLYVPALLREHDITATVFVDAALPPATGEAPLAPPALLPVLEGLAVDGLLPAWTRWWAPEEVDPLFPDAETRAQVEAEQHRLPLAYFRRHVTAHEGWHRTDAGYFAFGDTYAQEREQAASWGWPTTTLPGTHLHLLHDPPGVAQAVGTLLEGRQPTSPSRSQR